ncbi:ATP-dependent DNA helicase pif1 [Fusarium oxysporum f. sp. albedinis]|nr:ATP-dependent DNA helicase pif1 [Fusarium oxysporum f. sp. albedinis]
MAYITNVYTTQATKQFVLYIIIVDQIAEYQPPTGLLVSSCNIPNRDIGSALLATPWFGASWLHGSTQHWDD